MGQVPLSVKKKYRSTSAVLTLVGREAFVSLKGATAINFFVRDLPCVSVAIDEAIPYIGKICDRKSTE
jgi:hypothetical protein